MWLFFGCRQRALDLYHDEKSTMLEENVLDKVFLALSRESDIPKVSLKCQIVNELVKFKCNLIGLILIILDICTRPDLQRSRCCLQKSGGRRRSFLCLWRLHNGRTCLPDVEIDHTRAFMYGRCRSWKLHAKIEG